VAAALVSAVNGAPIPHDTVLFGEIGLGGEIRPVPQPAVRMKEAGKLGFGAAVIPAAQKKDGKPVPGGGMKVTEIKILQDLVDMYSGFKGGVRAVS